MQRDQVNPLLTGSLREICLDSCPKICGTCFHILAGGCCSISADPSLPACDYWVISFRDFLRAVKRWQQLHPGQLLKESNQERGPRRYALERDRISCEGFFPVSCYTCSKRTPGSGCRPSSGSACQEWEISLPYYLMGSHLWRQRHPWPEY